MGGGASIMNGGELSHVRPESREFIEELNGFLMGRDKMNAVAAALMPAPSKLAQFCDLCETNPPSQSYCDPKKSVEEQLDALYRVAGEAKQRLDEWCIHLVRQFSDPHREVLRQTCCGGTEKVFYAYSPAPNKRKERAAEKVKNEYNGDARPLVDIVRGSIVLESQDQIYDVLQHLRKVHWHNDTALSPQTTFSPKKTLSSLSLKGQSSKNLNGSTTPQQKGGRTFPTMARLRRYLSGLSDTSESNFGVRVIRCKNRFKKPTFNGYRDCLLNLLFTLGDGSNYVVELQIHHVELLKFKAETHKYYQYFRTYFSGNMSVVQERMVVLEAIARGDSINMKQLYEDALANDDEHKLRALDDLLDKLCELNLREPVCRRLLQLAERRYGSESTSHAFQIATLAELLRAKGDFDQAGPLYTKATDIIERLCGSEHANFATLLNNRALNLHSLGQYMEARRLFERSLHLRESLLGAQSSDVAQSLNNLALVLQEIGELDDAVACYTRAIDIKTETLGPENPALATSLINLGALLLQQDKNTQAAPHFERALDISEKSFGQNHPSTITAKSWHGNCLRKNGNIVAALAVARQVLASRTHVLGPDHYDTAAALSSLAQLLVEDAEGTPEEARQLRYDEALSLYERSLAIREQVSASDTKLNKEHPDVAKTLSSLARLLRQRSRLDEAEKYYRRALQIRECALGSRHPSVAESSNNLAGLLVERGQPVEAASHYTRAVEIWEQCLAPDHQNLATALNNLALVLWSQERFDEAIPRQERALDISRRRNSVECADEYLSELDLMRQRQLYPYE